MTRLTVTTTEHGCPCVTRAGKDGRAEHVFVYSAWYRKVKGLSPLQGLAREIVLGVLIDPSIGTIAQVADALQPSPKADELKTFLLSECRWAQRILNTGIKHLDPKETP